MIRLKPLRILPGDYNLTTWLQDENQVMEEQSFQQVKQSIRCERWVVILWDGIHSDGGFSSWVTNRCLSK